jgi:glutamyl-tRNA(Gln) amidotransferase subunit E
MALKEMCQAGEQDAVVIVADSTEKCTCAMKQIANRAELAILGIPEETRKMLEDGSTAYMRPLPGAARMYPETDVMPVCIVESYWQDLKIPELITQKAERFTKEYHLDPMVARQMAYSEYSSLFETAVNQGIKPSLVTRTLLATIKELARDGIPVNTLSGEVILNVLLVVSKGDAAKEAVPQILSAIATGMSVTDAIKTQSPVISEKELQIIVQAVIQERIGFVRERGFGAVAPLMGVVMKEVRGSVDGKVVNEAVRRGIEEFLVSDKQTE